MRVSCLTVGDFIENLTQVKDDDVHLKRVWINTTYQTMDGAKRVQDSVKVNVNFQASTVITTGDGDYILELGIECGVDYKDGPKPELHGTEEKERVRAEIVDYCERRGWFVLPGILDM